MTDEKVKEIKEILESCADDKKPCYKCKYYGKCEKLLDKQDILTLINELESENETYKRLAVYYYQKAQSYGIECIINDRLDKLIKELKND